ARGKVIMQVRFVIGDKIGPAEIAWAAGLVPFVMAPGPAGGHIGAGIRPYLAPVKPAGSFVDGHSERIAATHGVDLGPGQCSADWEKVPGGYGIGAVRLGMNPEDFAAQIVWVGGGFL